MNKHRSRIEQAYKDAVQIAVWRGNGIIPSRRYCLLNGMTQNRYENAIGLLRMSRIIIKHRTWETEDYSLIIARLKVAKQTAMLHPEAFHARLNSHARS